MTYYGHTPKGKKVHLGDRVQYSLVNRRREARVDTFCGAAMLAYENGELPPASLAQEFCKNCFRSYAWEVMLERMEQLARKEVRTSRKRA